MFAGGRRRTSNIKVMQLFHELKQQFPTIPDHIVTSYVTNIVNQSAPDDVSSKDRAAYRELIAAAAAFQTAENQEPMGRTLTKPTNSIISPTDSPLHEAPDRSTDFPKRELSNNPASPIAESKTTIKPDPAATSETQPEEKETSPISTNERYRSEMNDSASDSDRTLHSNVQSRPAVNSNLEKKSAPQRPNHLDINRGDATTIRTSIEGTGGFNKIQPSERCFDLQKLLNVENLNNKPPRSPISAKRFISSKNSPTKSAGGIGEQQTFSTRSLTSPDSSTRKTTSVPQSQAQNSTTTSASASTSGISSGGSFVSGGGSGSTFRGRDSPERRPETADTPTQTTETLMSGGSVNLSLNVNCQMDLVQSPTIPKHTSVLQMTPQMPWSQDPTSQRSYTSVNLTLRPPSSEPQPPIDITSQNSSLTYSTSSFDSQKGLQSRLQITVGPGGGSVSSSRVRPRSSYLPQSVFQEKTVPVRAGSLPDLATDSNSSVIIKQQVCIERLRIELITEKGRLIAMQEEVAALEKPNSLTSKVDAEIEKQLQKEIRHLRGQCERLTYEIDRQSESKAPLGETSEEFYQNIYTGQRGNFTSTSQSTTRHIHHRGSQQIPQNEVEDPKWNCHLCTFQNHPLLDKCEQCEMPRILHGTKLEPPNPCLTFGMVRPFGSNVPYNPHGVFNNINIRESHVLPSNMNNSNSNLQQMCNSVYNESVLPLNYQITSQHNNHNSSSVL